MYVALRYDYPPDVLERRGPHRPAHLAYAQRFHAAGKLLLAGAFDPPADGALFVFRVDSPAEVEAFAKDDPYVVNGVVTGHRVHPWNVVVGGA